MQIFWQQMVHPVNQIAAYYDRGNPEDGIMEDLFFITNYRKLTDNPEKVWEPTLRPANRFLTSLSSSDQHTLISFFNNARNLNSIFASDTIEKAINHIGRKFQELAVAINLPNKLLEYVRTETDITIPEHLDTPPNQVVSNMNTTDYHTLLAMSVLCKVMFPLFAEIITKTIQRGDRALVTNSICSPIIIPTFRHTEFCDTLQRLVDFIFRIVDDELVKMPFTLHELNKIISREDFCTHIIDIIIIKRLVTVDLMEPSMNLLVWIDQCVRAAVIAYSQLFVCGPVRKNKPHKQYVIGQWIWLISYNHPYQ